MSYTFDGASKRITLGPGTVELNLFDLYSRWKDWILAGNAGWLPAMHSVGGDIPAIPLYLFLDNAWRIVPQSADHTLTVVGGVLEVTGGGDPFVDPAGSYKIRIIRSEPAIAVGYSTTGGTAPSAATIAEAVWLRAIEGGLPADAVVRILLAALAGKSTGVGSSTEKYLARDGTTPRVIADFDSQGNRTDRKSTRLNSSHHS